MLFRDFNVSHCFPSIIQSSFKQNHYFCQVISLLFFCLLRDFSPEMLVSLGLHSESNSYTLWDNLLIHQDYMCADMNIANPLGVSLRET